MLLFSVLFYYLKAALNHLVSVVGHHGLVGDVSNGEYVRRIHCALDPDVHV